MRNHQPPRSQPLAAVIFDVDGVLLQSPHEQAWREALEGFGDPTRFTTATYQAKVAGKPRMDGARAALSAVGADVGQAEAYAEHKQARLEAIVREGGVTAFPDALRLVAALAQRGWPMAAASASKNANAMLAPLTLLSGAPLLSAFAANVCGIDVRHAKPGADLYVAAAGALGETPAACVVFEDAPVGIEAARAGGLRAVGVARLGDEDGLHKVCADLVVTQMDAIDLVTLQAGRCLAPGA